MRSTLVLAPLWALVLPASTLVIYSEDTQALQADSMRSARDLRTRSLPQTIGTFPLDAGFDFGTVVISITESSSCSTAPDPKTTGSTTPNPNGQGSQKIQASCLSCYTNGTGVVTTDGVLFNDTEFQNPIAAAEEFLTNPLRLIQDAFETEIELDLSDFTGHFEFEIDFSGSGSFDIPIPLPPTPLGGQFPNPPLPDPAPNSKLGLVPTVDIIFKVDGQLSTTIGFEFDFPKDSSYTIDPIHGHLISTNFGDVQFKPLPMKYKSGSGSLSVSLKVGASIGFTVNAFGEGFTLEAGAYSDVPTWTGEVTFNPAAACEVDFKENLAVDAAVYASAGGAVDGVKIGIEPSYVVTLASLTLPGTCLITNTASVSGVITASVSPAKAFVATSLATPITGPYIAATPVIDVTSLGVLPTTTATGN